MNRTSLIYAWVVILLGLTVLACACLGWQSVDVRGFMVCVGLASMTATLKFRMPHLTGTLSPAFIFLLVSVAIRSWSETVVIAAAAGIVQCVWRPQNRPSTLQVAFNTASLALSGGVAHAIARGNLVFGGHNVFALVLGAAAVSLLITNTLLVSTILCLIQEAPFYTAWRSIQLWAVPYYLCGGLLACVWAQADLSVQAGSIILAAASAYILSVCYREAATLIRKFDTQSDCAA